MINQKKEIKYYHHVLFCLIVILVTSWYLLQPENAQAMNGLECTAMGGNSSGIGLCPPKPLLGKITGHGGVHVLDCCGDEAAMARLECDKLNGEILTCGPDLLIKKIYGYSCCNKANPEPPKSNFKYIPLEPIFAGDTDGSFVHYIQMIYKFLIWTVGIAALLMLTIGGFMYMTSAGNQAAAGTAKKIIRDALLGLVIVLFTWVLLNLINPDLVKINLESVTGLKYTLNSSNSYPSNTPFVPNPQQPLPPSNPDVNKGSCQGLEVRNINQDQCKDVSEELGDFLSCLHGNLPSARINSISDDDAVNNLSRCQGSNYSKPPCDHVKNSCHYGGKDQRGVSCAVDISTTSGDSYGEIMVAAKDCGYAYSKDERATNHVHFSVPGCDCN